MEITKYELLYFIELHKDIDIQTLAEKIKVNRSFIYDVEAGRRQLSINLFEKTLKCFGVNYRYDYELFNEAYNLLVNLFKLYISYEYIELDRLYENYLIKKELYKSSKAFVVCDLIDAIYKIRNRKFNETKEYLDNSKKYLDLFDNNLVYIYLIIYILLKELCDDIEDIKQIALPMIKKYTFIDLNPVVEATLYYQIGRIKEVDGKIFEAIKWLDKSIQLYQELNIYQRVIQVKIQKGHCFFELRQYEDAKRVYLEMYEAANKYHFRNLEIVCLNILLFLNLIQEKYLEANKYIKLSRQIGDKSSALNYYQAYIVYKINDKNSARSIIKNLIESETNKKVLHILRFIRSILNENNSEAIKYLFLVKKDLIKINKKLDLQIIMKLAIDYFREHDKKIEYELMRDYIERYK